MQLWSCNVIKDRTLVTYIIVVIIIFYIYQVHKYMHGYVETIIL